MTTATAEPTVEINVRERRDELKVSRSALAELTGLTPAAIWRCEDGRGKQEELQVIAATLSGVEQNGLPEHLRRKRPAGRKSADTQRLQAVGALLVQALGAKTRRDVDDLIKQSLAIVAESVPTDETAETATA